MVLQIEMSMAQMILGKLKTLSEVYTTEITI